MKLSVINAFPINFNPVVLIRNVHNQLGEQHTLIKLYHVQMLDLENLARNYLHLQ